MEENLIITECISDILPDFEPDQMITFDEFIKKLTEEYQSRIEENCEYNSFYVKFKWWDAELQLYGERRETEPEKELRIAKEKRLVEKELAQLKRLKEKYGDV